jgi:Tfp pilus assembly protein PilO
MKLTKEKQQNLILTILLTVGVIYGVWVGGIDMQGKKESRDTKERDRLEKEIKDTENAIKRERNNREQAKVYQNYIAMTEEKMPKGNVETWLVKELSEIAAHHNLTLFNTALQPLKEISDFKLKGQPYQLEGFHMDFKGEYNQIGAFIQEVENQMPMVEIYDMSISKGGEGGLPHVHTVAMTVCVARKI